MILGQFAAAAASAVFRLIDGGQWMIKVGLSGKQGKRCPGALTQ